jgi:hypothetical protein
LPHPAPLASREANYAIDGGGEDDVSEVRMSSRLAADALEDARHQGLEVVPLCPFIAHYIDRHPESEELVASGYGDR